MQYHAKEMDVKLKLMESQKEHNNDNDVSKEVDKKVI